MAVKVIRTSTAKADLRGIAEYIGIEQQSPKAAEKFLHEIQERFVAYAHQPDMGDPQPELGEDLRSFAFKRNYVVIYRPLDNGIEVIRVIHGARDYPSLFGA